MNTPENTEGAFDDPHSGDEGDIQMGYSYSSD
jgi:hypothetical protein